MKYLSFILLALTLSFSFSCGGSSSSSPTTGTLTGTVTDAQSGTALTGVRVTCFDANTNSVVGSAVSTDSAGQYAFVLAPGTYYAKFSIQGYQNIPARGIAPLPLSVAAGQVVDHSVSMSASILTNTGLLSGTVTSGGVALANILVVAYDGTDGFSTVTDLEGNYTIYNVPAGTYSIQGWYAGYDSSEGSAAVTSGTETPDVDLVLTAGASGSVTGMITFLSTQNIEVDVSLTHPGTQETIPGLSTTTVSYNYTINNVPAGTYLARASFENDAKVMDPDWIIKNGEPFVTVLSSQVERDFSITGAVTLIGPTNSASSTQPLEVSGTSPTFSWTAYPSADDHVIEVTDQNGSVIWGGFNSDWSTRNIVIDKSETSVTYDFDSTASAPLEVGKIYRWRIYASKDDAQEANGWKLISASEEQRGIIRIVE